nr:hypothetical protein Iba_scaffold1717CG0140 [Ipomoea batatas]
MIRRKECAKKMMHDKFEVGSSSRNPPIETDEEGSSKEEGGQHEPIAGTRKLTLGTVGLAKVEELRKKPVISGRYLDMLLLDSFGCREGVAWLMAHRQWAEVFG